MCQEWLAKSDMSRATGEEWHVKSETLGMSSQEEQLIKSDTKHETCMFKNKMFLKMDKIVILRPCSASRKLSYVNTFVNNVRSKITKLLNLT